MNVDFRIGLTGTPIENSAADLWAIMAIAGVVAVDDPSGPVKPFGIGFVLAVPG
jgi:hypothetical protein